MNKRGLVVEELCSIYKHIHTIKIFNTGPIARAAYKANLNMLFERQVGILTYMLSNSSS